MRAATGMGVIVQIVETRTFGASRLQIAEHSLTGWTVTMFPPDEGTPVVFQSEQAGDLQKLVEQAKAKAITYLASADP
ncbi:hypothetical protein [Roseomonas sp. WA12]